MTFNQQLADTKDLLCSDSQSISINYLMRI